MLKKAPFSSQAEAGLVAKPSLRTSFSWIFAGNVINAGTQWGLLILLTKLFEPEVFGRFALALSIVTPIFVGSALQLRAVQVTDVQDTSRFTDYLLLRLATNLLAVLCIIAITLLGMIPAHLFGLTFLLGLNQSVLLVLDIYQGARQKQERMDLVAISQVRVGVVSLIAAAAAALLWHDIVLVAIAMLLARTVSILVFDIGKAWDPATFKRSDSYKVDMRDAAKARRLLRLAHTAFPLGIVMLLISLYPNVPRYFLAASGEATVGFFAAVASLVAVQDLITGALGQSAIPRLSRLYLSNRRAYVRLLAQMVMIFLGLGLAGVVVAIPLGKPLLTLFFRPEYAQFAEVFVWLLVASAVLNVKSAIGYGITAARIFRHQVWIEGLAILTLLLGAWLLVPSWQGRGAAWAMLISACVGLAASSIVLARALCGTGSVCRD